jgi:hypothetical protein
MDQISCFGVEYFDDNGDVCPFMECVARKDCKRICSSSLGLLHDRTVRIRSEEVEGKKLEKERKLKEKKKIKDKIFKIKEGVTRKSGYKRPRRLEYKNEGCIRDEMIDVIKDFFKDTKYTVKTTRYIQSVSDNFIGPLTTKYLIKISTTRKKSILVYITDKLAEALPDASFRCRKVYEYESMCFPSYLMWVVQISSMDRLQKFLSYLEV